MASAGRVHLPKQKMLFFSALSGSCIFRAVILARDAGLNNPRHAALKLKALCPDLIEFEIAKQAPLPKLGKTASSKFLNHSSPQHMNMAAADPPQPFPKKACPCCLSFPLQRAGSLPWRLFCAGRLLFFPADKPIGPKFSQKSCSPPPA